MTSNGAKRSHISAAVLALLALLFHAMSGQARTWQVGHGSGEIDSLATACRLAESGDTILIAPGRYVADQGFPPKPMIYVHNRSLTILGGGSRAADVVLVRHRLFFKACERTELRGVTFESGESTFLSDGNVYVSDCEFNDVHGNAMVIGEVGRTAVIEDCVFRRNGAPVRQTPTDYGGAIWAETGVRTTRCQFYDNVAEERGGAIFTPGEIAIEDCLFVRNEAAEGAAVWMGSQAGSVVRSCTFYENSCRNNADAALHVAWANYETEVEQCLFVGTRSGVGMFCDGLVRRGCCLYWDNEYGSASPYFYCPPTEGEIADPFFCDPAGLDFRVRVGSPCLSGNYTPDSTCGVIGAFGEGCGVSPVVRVTWGGIKSRFSDAGKRRDE